jgi:hypothetical protein
MDDAFRVGRIQSIGNLDGHIKQFLCTVWPISGM